MCEGNHAMLSIVLQHYGEDELVLCFSGPLNKFLLDRAVKASTTQRQLYLDLQIRVTIFNIKITR